MLISEVYRLCPFLINHSCRKRWISSGKEYLAFCPLNTHARYHSAVSTCPIVVDPGKEMGHFPYFWLSEYYLYERTIQVLFSARLQIVYSGSSRSTQPLNLLPQFTTRPSASSPHPFFKVFKQGWQCLCSECCFKVAVPRCLKLKFLRQRTFIAQHMFS